MSGVEAQAPPQEEAPVPAPAPDPLQHYYRSLNQHHFSVQLEFICSLANPSYVTYLAQEGYLQDKRFLRYLQHLYTYWRQPQWARFVRYPYGLYFLEACRTRTSGSASAEKAGMRWPKARSLRTGRLGESSRAQSGQQIVLLFSSPPCRADYLLFQASK